jgi:hypothetical protein
MQQPDIEGMSLKQRCHSGSTVRKSHDATEMSSERTLSSAYGTEKSRMDIVIEMQQPGEAKADRLDWVRDPSDLYFIPEANPIFSDANSHRFVRNCTFHI